MSSSMQSNINAPTMTKAPPVDENPFASMLSTFTSQLLQPQPKGIIVLLLLLMSFHFLISIFCCLILILSHARGASHSRWFLKRLYTQNPTGATAYRTPFYLVNVGTTMTICQLLSSVCAQVYLGIRVGSAVTPTAPTPSWFIVVLALGYLFEFISYWFLSHGLLVTFYYTRKSLEAKSNRLRRWTSLPYWVNFFFFLTPLVAAIAICATLKPPIQALDNILIVQKKLLATLGTCSLIWQQSRVASHEIPMEILTKLANCTLEVKESETNLAIYGAVLLYQTQIAQAAPLVLMIVSFMVFIFMISKLLAIQRSTTYPPNPPSNNPLALGYCLSQENCRNQDCSTSGCGRPSTEPRGDRRGFIKSWQSNKRLHHIVFRALGIFTAIITNLISTLIILIKASEIYTNPHWRGIASWIEVAGGAWSAIPVAYQCWRLHVESKDFPLDKYGIPKTPAFTHKVEAPKQASTTNAKCREPNSEVKLTEPIEIQAIPVKQSGISYFEPSNRNRT